MVPNSESFSPGIRNLTILIVEDEALVRMVIADEFRASGYTVIECSSGEEAWDLLMSGIEVDLLFSDVQMPGPLDGLALAHAVRERFRNLPIVIASAHLPATEAEAFDAFLQKPFAFDAALRQVARLLEMAAPNREGKEPA